MRVVETRIEQYDTAAAAAPAAAAAAPAAAAAAAAAASAVVVASAATAMDVNNTDAARVVELILESWPSYLLFTNQVRFNKNAKISFQASMQECR